MQNDPVSNAAFEPDVTGRFGMVPNFFRSARAAPGLMKKDG
jgi:hypothetical protein